MRSIQDGEVWDTPPQPVQRYQVEQCSASFQIWTEREPRKWVTAGKQLRMDFCTPAEVRWSLDSEGLSSPIATREIAANLHTILIPLPQNRLWENLQIGIGQSGSRRRLKLCSR
jgi:glucoamylase